METSLSEDHDEDLVHGALETLLSPNSITCGHGLPDLKRPPSQLAVLSRAPSRRLAPLSPIELSHSAAQTALYVGDAPWARTFSPSPIPTSNEGLPHIRTSQPMQLLHPGADTHTLLTASNESLPHVRVSAPTQLTTRTQLQDAARLPGATGQVQATELPPEISPVFRIGQQEHQEQGQQGSPSQEQLPGAVISYSQQLPPQQHQQSSQSADQQSSPDPQQQALPTDVQPQLPLPSQAQQFMLDPPQPLPSPRTPHGVRSARERHHGPHTVTISEPPSGADHPEAERTSLTVLPSGLSGSRSHSRNPSRSNSRLGSCKGSELGTPERVTGSELWQRAQRKVTLLMSASSKFRTLRDMGDANFIPVHQLQTMRQLGQGAFATVELALYSPGAVRESDGPDTPTTTGHAHATPVRVVAVKRLKPGVVGSQPEEVEAFLQEVQLARKLAHRKIVPYVGVGQDGSAAGEGVFLVVEAMHGGTLKRRVQKQMQQGSGSSVYSYCDALRWAADIASALHYLHSCQPRVIHRDLKLENVLLTDTSSSAATAKLADFGLSALMRKKQMGDIARETLGSCVKQSGQQPASAQAAAEPPPRPSPTATWNPNEQDSGPQETKGPAPAGVQRTASGRPCNENVAREDEGALGGEGTRGGPGWDVGGDERSKGGGRVASVRRTDRASSFSSSAAESSQGGKKTGSGRWSLRRFHSSKVVPSPCGGGEGEAVPPSPPPMHQRQNPMPASPAAESSAPSQQPTCQVGAPPCGLLKLGGAGVLGEGVGSVACSPSAVELGAATDQLGAALEHKTGAAAQGGALQLQDSASTAAVTGHSPDVGPTSTPATATTSSQCAASVQCAAAQHKDAALFARGSLPLVRTSRPSSRLGLMHGPATGPQSQPQPHTHAHGRGDMGAAAAHALHVSHGDAHARPCGSCSLRGGEEGDRGSGGSNMTTDQRDRDRVSQFTERISPLKPGSALSERGSGRERGSNASTGTAGSLVRRGVCAGSGINLSVSLKVKEAQALLSMRTGTLMYMAPEVFQSHNYDEKADVFSFALIMYELFHKLLLQYTAVPRGTLEEVEAYARGVAGGYRPPLGRHIPPPLAKIITDCWAQDPSHRPPMSSVLEALQQLRVQGVAERMDQKAAAAGTGCGCVVS